MGGADLHKRSAEGWKETEGGRVAPILDGTGDVPPKSGSCGKHVFSRRRCQSKAERPQRKGVGKERMLVATATAADSGAWEHPTAAGGCAKNETSHIQFKGRRILQEGSMPPVDGSIL